jgi:hypothetical protein
MKAILPRNTAVLLARYGIPITIATVLFAGLRLYSFTYFWLDDFNNVYWARREGFLKIIGHLLNPTSLFFRPLGMLVYWILFRFAALNPFPYHLVSWTLLALNTALVFLFLRQATKSQYAAGMAVLLFAFRTNFGDIYWNFSHIFQLLALALVLTGMLLYARFGYSARETLALTAVLVLTIRAEEQGVLLPVLWFAYEWLIRGKLDWRRLWARYAVFAAVMAWFTFFKLTTMHATDVTRPYYMDLSALTFGRGYGWYFNSLYHTNLRWGGWFIGSALLAAAFAVRKNRWGLFFLLFTYVTLLPYIFLVNHRFELYSYMAFVGIAGILALGFRELQRDVRRLLPVPLASAVLSILFVVVSVEHYRHEERLGRMGRGYLAGVLSDYRAFLSDLRSMPDAGTVQMLYYTAIPRHMDEGTLLCSTQFGLDRVDVDTKMVEACPAAEACVAFENGHLRRIQ